VKGPPRSADLLAFMKARHAIYLKRAAGKPKPWTTDPVLLRYRFCNVYRELDTVTQWVRTRIREPYYDHPNLWFMLAMARQINWPDTLQEIMDAKAWPVAKTKYDPEKIRAVMLARQARGEQLYTGAYMLNAHGIPPGAPKDKAYFTTSLVLGSVWERREAIAAAFMCSMRDAWESLLPGHGWGPFTAYEVVCDARYTRYGTLASWQRDVHTWSNAGPGAVRGLNRLLGRELTANVSPARALAEMIEYHEALGPRWPHAPHLELREIEHSLCEFDKYERVRLGEGRPRSTYQGV
jgi:hypothetical protein